MMFDENFYREQILDHYKSPRNRGELDPHDATAEGVNPLCGDEITVDLRLTDDSASRPCASAARAARSRRRRCRC